MKDDIIEYVNILLENSGITISDNRLSFLVDDFYDEVCIYCNRMDFPEQLERVTAKIIYSYLIQNNSQSGSGARVNSISEDGRTVNFDLNGITIDEKNQIYATTLLNRFKKLYRVEDDSE
jgi:hypothetical protein